MKKIIIRVACLISIILIVAASGCVAPPKENATSTKSGSNVKQSGIQTTATPNYVTEVTPIVTNTPASGFEPVPTTQPPGDLYCRIYLLNTTGYNYKAIEFNLQNPPMYINYTIKPHNITITEIVSELGESKKYGTEKFVKISKYDPNSWFSVTVLNKSSGEKYLEDGFGTQKYSLYLNHTLKVLNRDNMLIEFRSNNITATAMVWVKPARNIDDPKFNLTTDCTYFGISPRDVLPISTTKTTATPTYRLQ
jgi:hypothetical protein